MLKQALIIIFFLLFSSNESFSQSTLYICDEQGGVYELDLTTCSTTLISSGIIIFTDLAYSSQNNTLYGIDEFGFIYEINATTGAVTFLGVTNVVSNFSYFNSLTCDDNGTLYISAYDPINSGGYIYSYNLSTNTSTAIGNLPALIEPAGDLTFLNGQLVLSAYSNEVYAINLSSPALSISIGAYQGITNVYGIVSMNCGQDPIISSGNQLFSLDTVTFQASLICTIPFIVDIYGAATSSETTLDLDLGQDTTLCGALSYQLDALNSGASYLWSDNSINQTVNVTSTGTYWVEITDNNCTAYDTIDVIFVSNTSVFIGNDTTLCPGDDIILNAGSSGTSYLWSDNSTMQTLLVDMIGTYWVEITTDVCVFSDTIEISEESIFIGLPTDTTLCSGGSLILDANNSGASYIWNNGITSQYYSVTSEGQYWVTVTLGSCESTDTTNVLFSSQSASFQVMDTVGCSPLNTLFLDQSSSTDGTNSWLWNFGDGATSTNQNPVHTYSSSGIYNVTLTISSVNGCQDSYSRNIEIIIYPSPIADFSYFPLLPQFGEPVLFTNESLNSTSWIWNFGNGDSSTLENPTSVYSNSGNYLATLEVFAANGCVDSAQIYFPVNFDPIAYVPNSFSPDGDEFNNVFLPIFSSGLDNFNFHLLIFNRWGEVLFESFNHEIGWDGTYKGQIVKNGTYIWSIKYSQLDNSEHKIINGHVNVLR